MLILLASSCGTGEHVPCRDIARFRSHATEQVGTADEPEARGYTYARVGNEAELGCACELLDGGGVDSVYVSGQVESLEPLSCTDELRALRVEWLALETLDGVEHLETLELLALERVEGLLDLTGLAGLEGHVAALHVDETYELTSLAGLEGVESVGSLRLRRAPISDLAGLSGLVEVGDLHLQSLQTSDYAGLEGLETVHGTFQLWDMPTSTLRGLDGIERMGRVTIDYCRGLGTLEGLSEDLVVDGSIFLHNLPALTDLGGFASLEEAPTNLTLAWLPKLAELPVGLERVGKSLYLGGLDQLEQLDLPLLSRVGSDLSIVGNESLVSLEGLGALQSIGGNLLVQENPALPDAEIEAFVARVEIAGAVIVADNGG